MHVHWCFEITARLPEDIVFRLDELVVTLLDEVEEMVRVEVVGGATVVLSGGDGVRVTVTVTMAVVSCLLN